MSSSDSDDQSRAEGVRNWVRKYSEEEQATALIIIGVFLFLFPPTTIIGIIVLIIGIATWVSDWIWG